MRTAGPGAARRRREPQGPQAAASARVHFPQPLHAQLSSFLASPPLGGHPPAPPGSTRLLSTPGPPPAPFPVEKRLSPAAFASRGARRHSQTLGRSHRYPPLSRGKGGPRPKKVSVPPAFKPHRWPDAGWCPARPAAGKRGSLPSWDAGLALPKVRAVPGWESGAGQCSQGSGTTGGGILAKLFKLPAPQPPYQSEGGLGARCSDEGWRCQGE